ncbi:MAG TPA: NUDIX domain-containing protein, partial [Actinomycetota bacterium]|nr:NUDIX domain-containing protein [Actinomycetota bacterium]
MTPESGGRAELARYRELVLQRPELFVNPADGGFTILLDEQSIGAAEEAAPGSSHGVGVVYEDEYVVLLRDAVAFPDGRLGTYIRMVGPRAEPTGVAVLPIHDQKVVLVRHFRHATRSRHWEIPRGFWIEGLTGEQVARQELEEELGISRCD